MQSIWKDKTIRKQSKNQALSGIMKTEKNGNSGEGKVTVQLLGNLMKKTLELGVPGWHSQLGIQLFISSQVMISGLRDRALLQASHSVQICLRVSLPLPLPLPLMHTLILSL